MRPFAAVICGVGTASSSWSRGANSKNNTGTGGCAAGLTTGPRMENAAVSGSGGSFKSMCNPVSSMARVSPGGTCTGMMAFPTALARTGPKVWEPMRTWAGA